MNLPEAIEAANQILDEERKRPTVTYGDVANGGRIYVISSFL
jgi:hypothetical protein